MSYLNARDSNICKQLEILSVCKSKVDVKIYTTSFKIIWFSSQTLHIFLRLYIKLLQVVNIHCIKNTFLGTISQKIAWLKTSDDKDSAVKWTLVTVQRVAGLSVINPSPTSKRGHNFPLVKKLPCNVLWTVSHKTFSQLICAMGTGRSPPPHYLLFWSWSSLRLLNQCAKVAP